MSGILYSAIARQYVLLASSQKVPGNFESLTLSMLSKIPTDHDTKTSYSSDEYMFHVLVENGIIYLCAANTAFGRRLPYAFLLEIKRRFTSGSLHTRAKYALEHELERDFGHIMQQQMARFSSGEGDQIMELQSQVDGVMGVMTQNIEKIIERGDKIDDLLDKTAELDVTSSQFRSTSRQVRRKMWWKNCKMWVILGIVAAIIITFIVLMATNIIPVKGSGNGNNDSPKPTAHTY